MKPKQRRGRYSDEMRADLNTNFTRGTTLSAFHAAEREKSDRQKERDLRAWRRKLSGVLLIVTLISGMGLLLLTQFSGSFADVISNATTLKASDANKYKEIINKYLSKNPFERLSFARRNDNLTNYVAEQAPEIKAVRIEQAGMLLGKLHLDFREPVAMWTAANVTSYVDADGVVFAHNYFESPTVTITDNSGATVGSDTAVTSSRFLGFVGRVTAELSNGGNEVERVVIPTGAIRYIEFYLIGRKYSFKAQIDRDAVAQAADIAIMAKYLDNKRLVPAYVDVRVAGKAYWRK
ncbi:MAG: hypothetical protein LBQ11_01295 [Candidatus Nomurabacteria bacterium]|jgi:hypothetical protein|nr:hypothetical protein [Candidatus Nomurabacteria bacterium]